MSSFQDAQINRWAYEYEREICAKNNFIAARLSLAITAGVSEYELPNYVTNIRMILWKGKELWPKGGTSSQYIGDVPMQPSSNTPFEYIFNTKGLRVIKFYPCPSVAVAAYGGDLWTPAADAAAVIVECYRTPDGTIKLPTWFRRYNLKDHVCWKAFNSEGPTNDIRAAKFYEEVKMPLNANLLGKIKVNMFKCGVRAMSASPITQYKRPGRPVLPPNFGGR